MVWQLPEDVDVTCPNTSLPLIRPTTPLVHVASTYRVPRLQAYKGVSDPTVVFYKGYFLTAFSSDLRKVHTLQLAQCGPQRLCLCQEEGQPNAEWRVPAAARLVSAGPLAYNQPAIGSGWLSAGCRRALLHEAS